MIELLTSFYSGLTFDFQATSKNVSKQNFQHFCCGAKLHNQAKRQNVVGHPTSEYFHFSVYRTATLMLDGGRIVEIRLNMLIIFLPRRLNSSSSSKTQKRIKNWTVNLHFSS
jgi:hypothetical protein